MPLQAFFAGKAACGLFMAGLRCASKAALPGKDTTSLQLGTAVFLAVGVLLVGACVFIVAVVLPRLTTRMTAVEETPGKHTAYNGCKCSTAFKVAQWHLPRTQLCKAPGVVSLACVHGADCTAIVRPQWHCYWQYVAVF